MTSFYNYTYRNYQTGKQNKGQQRHLQTLYDISAGQR